MTKRRWLKSIIATSKDAQPAMPFHRTIRRKPQAVQAATDLRTIARPLQRADPFAKGPSVALRLGSAWWCCTVSHAEPTF